MPKGTNDICHLFQAGVLFQPGLLFQAGVLFCKENAKYCPKYFGPVSVNLGYFFANLRTFLVYFLQASIVWWCTKIHKYQVCMYLRFFTGVQIVWQTLPPPHGVQTALII